MAIPGVELRERRTRNRQRHGVLGLRLCEIRGRRKRRQPVLRVQSPQLNGLTTFQLSAAPLLDALHRAELRRQPKPGGAIAPVRMIAAAGRLASHYVEGAS